MPVRCAARHRAGSPLPLVAPAHRRALAAPTRRRVPRPPATRRVTPVPAARRATPAPSASHEQRSEHTRRTPIRRQTRACRRSAWTSARPCQSSHARRFLPQTAALDRRRSLSYAVVLRSAWLRSRTLVALPPVTLPHIAAPPGIRSALPPLYPTAAPSSATQQLATTNSIIKCFYYQSNPCIQTPDGLELVHR